MSHREKGHHRDRIQSSLLQKQVNDKRNGGSHSTRSANGRTDRKVEIWASKLQRKDGQGEVKEYEGLKCVYFIARTIVGKAEHRARISACNFFYKDPNPNTNLNVLCRLVCEMDTPGRLLY